MARSIVHTANYETRVPGGFVRALRELAERSRERHEDFSLIVPAIAGGAAWHEELRAGAVSVRTVRSEFDLARAVAACAPDVLHVHFSRYLVCATAAVLARTTRVFWHLHSGMLPVRRASARWMARSAKYALLGARTRAMIAVSSELRDALVASGVPNRKIAVLPNGVDDAFFRVPSPAQRAAERERLQIGQDERVLLFFGRDAWVKGADVLEAALRTAPRSTVLCVASPPSVVDRLQSAARTISVGTVEDVRALYWAADALVMPSRIEGSPLALLEARCCGLPVVASRIASIEETARLVPPVTLVEPQNAAALAQALRRLPPAQPLTAAQREAVSLVRWSKRIMALYER